MKWLAPLLVLFSFCPSSSSTFPTKNLLPGLESFRQAMEPEKQLVIIGRLSDEELEAAVDIQVTVKEVRIMGQITLVGFYCYFVTTLIQSVNKTM
jgi:hypothetical protein